MPKTKCKKPEPDAMYGKDDLKRIHFWCVNCGAEVINIKKKGEKEFRWIHGYMGLVPITDD